MPFASAVNKSTFSLPLFNLYLNIITPFYSLEVGTMPYLKILVKVCMLCVLATSVYAEEPKTVSEESLKQAVATFDKKDYQAAYKEFSKLFDIEPQNDVVNFYLGRSALELKQYEEAIGAFERVLIIKPGFSRARIELARAYFEAGNLQEAERLVKIVLENPELPANVRPNVEKFAQVIEAKKKKSFVSGFMLLGLTRDDNVNNTVGQTEYFLPVLNNNVAAAAKKSDFTTSVIFGLNHVYDLGKSGDWLWKSTGLGFFQKYQDVKTNEISLVSITTGPSYMTKAYELYLPVSYTKIYKQAAPYMIDNTIAAKYTRKLPIFNLTTSASLKMKTYEKEADRRKDSLTQELSIGISRPFAEVYTLSASCGMASERSDDGNQSDVESDTIKYSLSLAKKINDKLDVTLSHTFKDQGYTLTDPSFSVKRGDQQRTYGASAMYKINKKNMFKFDYTFTDNASNIAAYDYEKNTVAFNYMYLF